LEIPSRTKKLQADGQGPALYEGGQRYMSAAFQGWELRTCETQGLPGSNRREGLKLGKIGNQFLI